jgi:hypothetical protein
VENENFETMRWMHLIERLSGARGKDIPAPTIKRLYQLFDEMGAKDAEYVTSVLEDYQNLPSNVAGEVKNIWKSIKGRRDNEQLWRETWQAANEECTTGEEYHWFFMIVTEVLGWHSKKMVQKNETGLSVPVGILEWKKMGCPKTWCPILDHFLEGFLRAHSLPGKGCEEFLRKYYQMLLEQRNKRTGSEAR